MANPLRIESLDPEGSIHDRPTDPWLPNFDDLERGSAIRPVYWSVSFARTRYELWAHIRNAAAITLAKLAGWIAP